MEKELLFQARGLYHFVKKAGLLSSETFSDIFSENIISNLIHDIARDKKNFLKHDHADKSLESIWEQGILDRVRKFVRQTLVDYLQEKGKAFMINWDQPVEDIVYNFKSVNSDLDISDLGEKQINGQWVQGMKIGEKQFWYSVNPEGFVTDVLKDINRYLQPLSKLIICSGVGDENQYLVISQDLLPDFEKYGFASI